MSTYEEAMSYYANESYDAVCMHLHFPSEKSPDKVFRTSVIYDPIKPDYLYVVFGVTGGSCATAVGFYYKEVKVTDFFVKEFGYDNFDPTLWGVTMVDMCTQMKTLSGTPAFLPWYRTLKMSCDGKRKSPIEQLLDRILGTKNGPKVMNFYTDPILRHPSSTVIRDGEEDRYRDRRFLKHTGGEWKFI